jgi:dethiobiotin synthetase
MHNKLDNVDKSVSGGGLTILGTEFGCGKTTLITGLTALLNEQGFQARAIKPVVLGNWQAELSFISTITRIPLDYNPELLETGIGLNSTSWRNSSIAKGKPCELTLIELPGSCSTPLIYDSQLPMSIKSGWWDCCDLALQYGYPCLLVARHNSRMLEKLSVHSSYIKSKGLNLIGLITVEVSEGQGTTLQEHLTRTQTELLLLTRTQIPYLGCIKYSPSISVAQGNQGNLIKLTSTGLELLGLMKALNLKIPLC